MTTPETFVVGVTRDRCIDLMPATCATSENFGYALSAGWRCGGLFGRGWHGDNPQTLLEALDLPHEVRIGLKDECIFLRKLEDRFPLFALDAIAEEVVDLADVAWDQLKVL